MKWHLRRFGWLYLTLFAAIAWPVFLIRQQAAPTLDTSSVRRLAEAIHTEFARQHPELRIRNVDDNPLYQELGPQATQSVLDNRLQDLMAGGAAATEAMRPELDNATKRHEKRLKTLDALSSSGIVFTHMLPPPGKKEPSSIQVDQQIPNLMMLQTLARLRRVQAEAAIRVAHWDDALRLLESTARIGDSLRYAGLYGLLLDVAIRNMGYSGYNTLLHTGAPPEVERAALDSLIRLRSSDPVFDEWSWLGERIFSLNYLIYLSETKPNERKDAAGRALSPAMVMQLGMMQAATTLALQKDRIKDPVLRARAESFCKDVKVLDVIAGVRGGPRPEQIKWTTIPATRKWLQEMLEREPWVRQEAFGNEFKVLPAAVTAKLDPWTVLLLSQGVNKDNLLEIVKRTQIAKTKGRLLEAAFAARLYQEKTGAWPKDMKDLAGFYPLSEEAKTSSGIRGLWFDTRAFLPLRIAELPMTDELRNRLWGEVLPLQFLNAQSGDNILKADGTLDCSYRGPANEWVKEPVRLSALEEALRAHPGLVENVQAFQTHTLAPPEVATASGDRYQWQIMTPEEARQATAGTDASDPRIVVESKVTPLMGVRLKAKLRAPEKTMVIWSPGPDGKDNGGQICYDPSNGTLSAGDMLVFPEKY